MKVQVHSYSEQPTEYIQDQMSFRNQGQLWGSRDLQEYCSISD